MSHSNQIREFLLSSAGIRLVEVYLGPAGMLTGSARVAQEALERDAALRRQDESRRTQAQLDRKREAMEARISAIRTEFEAEENEMRQLLATEEDQDKRILDDKTAMSRSRRANGGTPARSHE